MAGPAGAAEPDVATTKAVLRRADITAGVRGGRVVRSRAGGQRSAAEATPATLRTAKRSARRHLDVRCR